VPSYQLRLPRHNHSPRRCARHPMGHRRASAARWPGNTPAALPSGPGMRSWKTGALKGLWTET